MNRDLLFEDRISIDGEYVRVLKNNLKASSFEEPIGYKNPNFSPKILELEEIIALNQQIISKNITELARKYGFNLEAKLENRILVIYGASTIALPKLMIYGINLGSGIDMGSVFIDRSPLAGIDRQQKNLFKLFLQYQKYFDQIVFDAYDLSGALRYLLVSGVLAEEYPLTEIKAIITKLSSGLNVEFRNFSPSDQIIIKMEKDDIEFSLEQICSSEITPSGEKVEIIDPVKLSEYGLPISRKQAGVLFSSPRLKEYNWHTLHRQGYWRLSYDSAAVVELNVDKILEDFLYMEFDITMLNPYDYGLRKYRVKLRPYPKDEKIISSLFHTFEEFVETLFQLGDADDLEGVVCRVESDLRPYYENFCFIATSIFDKHRQVAN